MIPHASADVRLALQSTVREAEAAMLRSLNGSRFSSGDCYRGGDCQYWTLDIVNSEVVFGFSMTFGAEMRRLNQRDGDPWSARDRAPLEGRRFVLRGAGGGVVCNANCPSDCRPDNTYWLCPQRGEIQPDGDAIILSGVVDSGRTQNLVYKREGRAAGQSRLR